jgi:hypothetical protein
MEEESFFVSADEAEEGEAAHRDARRVGDGKGDGARRAETGRGDDDAFEDASDAADDAFEDPIDTSNAPAASSGGEFVSGTDTDGGGHRRAPRAPPRARAALPGVATSRVTRGSRVDDVEDDASLARRGRRRRRRRRRRRIDGAAFSSKRGRRDSVRTRRADERRRPETRRAGICVRRGWLGD